MILKRIMMMSLLMVSVLMIQAQPQDLDPLDPGGPQPPPGGGVPVDGGLAFLLAAGAGYGAKKAYDYRKNKVKSEK